MKDGTEIHGDGVGKDQQSRGRRRNVCSLPQAVIARSKKVEEKRYSGDPCTCFRYKRVYRRFQIYIHSAEKKRKLKIFRCCRNCTADR